MDEGAPKSVAKTGEEPTKIIEISGVKLEVGPDLGELSWDGMNQNIAELNRVLTDGKKPWRVLTKEEYEELGKHAKVIRNDEELSEEQNSENFNKFVINLGFTPDRYYRSSTEDEDDKNYTYGWYTRNGDVGNLSKKDSFFVQVFREI
jgi:hypothetical protein